MTPIILFTKLCNERVSESQSFVCVCVCVVHSFGVLGEETGCPGAVSYLVPSLGPPIPQKVSYAVRNVTQRFIALRPRPHYGLGPSPTWALAPRWAAVVFLATKLKHMFSEWGSEHKTSPFSSYTRYLISSNTICFCLSCSDPSHHACSRNGMENLMEFPSR